MVEKARLESFGDTDGAGSLNSFAEGEYQLLISQFERIPADQNVDQTLREDAELSPHQPIAQSPSHTDSSRPSNHIQLVDVSPTTEMPAAKTKPKRRKPKREPKANNFVA